VRPAQELSHEHRAIERAIRGRSCDRIEAGIPSEGGTIGLMLAEHVLLASRNL
jgi:hypothetical protein